MRKFLYLDKNFEDYLKRKASELSGIRDSLLAKQNIRIAPLQISTQAFNLNLTNTSGHFHHRKELSDIYNKPPAGDIDHTQLFTKARKVAARESQRACDSEEAREKYQLIHGNIVGIIGQAGIGKTTLTKTLVSKMLNKGLYDAEYVFFVQFRNVDYEKTTNFLEFITNDSSICETFNEEEQNTLLRMLDSSEKVGIVLDGFDEANITESFELFPKCSIYDTKKAETFIKNLLTGNILPRAKLLITSRPQQLLSLPRDCKPKFIVNILGLEKQGQIQICTDVCKGEIAQVDKLTRYIDDRPDLRSYCYVPVNCILIMLCIFLTFQDSDIISMDSITTIFVATLNLFIENGHLRNEELQLRNLCHLAFSGFSNNKLYFDKRDLKRANIDAKAASAFLTYVLTPNVKLKLLQGVAATRVFFSHLMLQEFFVALHLLLFVDEKQFKASLQHLSSSQFEIVTKFLFGLGNTSTLDYLRELIPDEIDDSQIEMKLTCLKEFAFEQLSNKRSRMSLSDFLSFSTWVYEMRNKDFSATIADSFDEEIELEGEVLPSDIPAFHYMMRSRTHPFNIANLNVNGPKDALTQFFHELNATLQSSAALTVSYCLYFYRFKRFESKT